MKRKHHSGDIMSKTEAVIEINRLRRQDNHDEADEQFDYYFGEKGIYNVFPSKMKTVMKTIKVMFYHPTRGGPVNPYFFTKNGKTEWSIKARTKTEFYIKLRQLRKKLGINRWFITESNNWRGFAK